MFNKLFSNLLKSISKIFRPPQPLIVRNNKIYIGGEKQDGYAYVERLGQGANAIVHLLKNNSLDRLEAVKIWQKLRESDERPKDIQAMNEALKLSKSGIFEQVPTVYSFKMIKNLPVMHMEYVKGKTIKKYLEEGSIEPRKLIGIAALYISTLFEVSQKHIHGDPHWSNVMIVESLDEERISLKLLDFGTSIFSAEGFSEARNWEKIEETVTKLLRNLPSFKSARAEFLKDVQLKPMDLQFAMYKDFIEHIAFVELKDPQFWQRMAYGV